MSLIGIFEQVRAPSFPVRHPAMCVYTKLTDAAGEYDIRLDLVRLDDMQIIGQGQMRPTFPDRMAPVEIVVQLLGIVFERPGRYEFQLWANGRWVGSKSLAVLLLGRSRRGGGRAHMSTSDGSRGSSEVGRSRGNGPAGGSGPRVRVVCHRPMGEFHARNTQARREVARTLPAATWVVASRPRDVGSAEHGSCLSPRTRW